MTKEEMIEKLWGQSNHGTQREDIEAAYNAGAAAEREACAEIADEYEYQLVAGSCARDIRARCDAY